MVPRLRELVPPGGGSQEAGFMQPRDHSLAEPRRVIFFCSHLWIPFFHDGTFFGGQNTRRRRDVRRRVVDFGGGRAGIISGSDGQRSCACVTFDECHFRRYFRESKMGNQSNGPLERK